MRAAASSFSSRRCMATIARSRGSRPEAPRSFEEPGEAAPRVVVAQPPPRRAPRAGRGAPRRSPRRARPSSGSAGRASPCRRPRGGRSRRPAPRGRARRTPRRPLRGCGRGWPRHPAAGGDCWIGSKRSARSAYGRVSRGMGQAASISRPATRHGLVLGVLALGGAAYALLQSLVVPALTVLQQDLHTPRRRAWRGSSRRTCSRRRSRRRSPAASATSSARSASLVVVLAGLGAGTLLAALATTLAADDRRPRDPGPRRRDLPARLRDHPRRVPARARRRLDRPHVRPARHRRRARDRALRPDPRRTSPTTGSSGSRSPSIASTMVATVVLDPGVARARAGQHQLARRRPALRPGSTALLLAISQGSTGAGARRDARAVRASPLVLARRLGPRRDCARGARWST